jgi:hypothetical protein
MRRSCDATNEVRDNRTMNPEDTPIARPSWLRRFAAGAWHVPGGALWLLRHPRLWPLGLLPAVLGLAGLGGGLLLGVYGVPRVEAAIAAHRPHLDLPDLVDLAAVIGLWVGTLGTGVLAALALVMLLCAPLLERLGRRAEALAGGTPPARWPRWREVLLTYARALPLVGAVPAAFVLSLLPFLGPLIAGLVLARVTAAQQTAPALALRGHARGARRAWHHDWRPESLGFGVTALLLLPLAAPLLVPGLAVGAALLVYEIEGDAPPEADAASAKAPADPPPLTAAVESTAVEAKVETAETSPDAP